MWGRKLRHHSSRLIKMSFVVWPWVTKPGSPRDEILFNPSQPKHDPKTLRLISVSYWRVLAHETWIILISSVLLEPDLPLIPFGALYLSDGACVCSWTRISSAWLLQLFRCILRIFRIFIWNKVWGVDVGVLGRKGNGSGVSETRAAVNL